MIYLDHAATSFPKPQPVIDAVQQALTSFAANPGRGSYRLSREAHAAVDACREKAAAFFGVKFPERVIFHANATAAINASLAGLQLEAGDHVIATTFEHNAVRRVLERMKKEVGIKVSYISPEMTGETTLSQWEEVKTERTKAVVTCHGSNVTGTILDLEPVQVFAAEHNLFWLIDASQTAGVLPVDVQGLGASAVACAGHKGLLGPQGTGLLLLHETTEPAPWLVGGTGAHSHTAEMPDALPERLEAGTLNVPGIAGLAAGIDEINRYGLNEVFEHEQALAARIIRRLQDVEGIDVYGPGADQSRLGVVSLHMQGVDGHEAESVLDQHYNIAVRAGLHCAPLAHEFLGTAPDGLLRVSVGFFTTEEDVDAFIQAVIEVYEGLA
ncbi:cysteine desulfurase family protein [Salsuginibacillus halophilus]|uniref:cysteine desulfurase n=1 Tax=Salsuginibacillus halophilus TaxID=517424 RepID=A0A2P8HI89_9BACI|nr:aminotransferase class V-fold PLP-dependent enzyme [Salsuginibacillus halophilus]PSL45931.1 cysteine desulfurase family protein [Salsuginibacillus halophilus]